MTSNTERSDMRSEYVSFKKYSHESQSLHKQEWCYDGVFFNVKNTSNDELLKCVTENPRRKKKQLTITSCESLISLATRDKKKHVCYCYLAYTFAFDSCFR